MERCVVAKVHYDSIPPSYTVRIHNGRAIGTEGHLLQAADEQLRDAIQAGKQPRDVIRDGNGEVSREGIQEEVAYKCNSPENSLLLG